MQKLIIIGNLTHDPESRTTQDGRTVCNFTVAVNRRQTAQQRQNGQRADADFFRVAAWGQMGENCQKYLARGRKVGVTGKVSCSAFLAQDGSAKANLEVFAEEVEFLTAKSDSAGNGESGSGHDDGEHESSVQPNLEPIPVNPDELPF